jgi:hypothetical protein
VAARVVGDGCCKNLRMRERWGGGGQPRKREGGQLQPKGIRGRGGLGYGGTSGPDRDPRPNSLSRLLLTPSHKSNKNSTVLLVNTS